MLEISPSPAGVGSVVVMISHNIEECRGIVSLVQRAAQIIYTVLMRIPV